MQEKQSPKKLWLAVLLNLFPPPLCLGYAYLRLWRRWLNVFLYCLIAWFVTGATPWWWDSVAAFFLVWLIVLVDVQTQARLVNLEAETPNPASVDELLAAARESNE
jgi:hypothetical protein